MKDRFSAALVPLFVVIWMAGFLLVPSPVPAVDHGIASTVAWSAAMVPTSSPPAPVAIPRDARQVRPGDAPAPTATAPAVFRHVGDTQASLRTTTTPIVVRNTPGGDCPGGICRVPQRGEPTPADASTKPSETPATAKGPVKSVLARTWNAKPVQAVGGRVRGVLGRLRCRGCR